ncbi:MAG: PBP1A family penicillin-binding protein [Heliobacteriaceae bacterium]|nr:PBP1A family penicillin-binding protein [Heliobacteriaceae bacterium]
MSHSPKPPEPPTPNVQPSKRIWRYILLGLAGLLILGFVAGLGTLAYFLRDRPQFDPATLGSLQATSFIYDQDGNQVTTLHGEQNRVPVSLDQIPLVLQQAVLAAEDIRFYEHQGVDLRAIARAALANIIEGRYSQGASTITQQLIKNTFLTTEKTMKRKVQEAYLAWQLESEYSKEQILEMYLNRIYFGHGSYGVQAAAQTYFGKDVSAVNLAEAALLAGLPCLPSYYSPVTNPERALERRSYVLSVMAKNDLITPYNLAQAQKQPLPHQLHGFTPGRYPYAAYIDYVIDEVVSRHGFTENQIFNGGLKIYTSLDPHLQQQIETVLTDESFYPPGPDDQPVQAAMAVINHNSGEIKGLGGGRNYDGRRSFNRATQLRRQPGSVIKPVMVYGPAMEKGYSPDDVLVDEPVNFSGYAPVNYDGQYRGPVTIRQAVAQSINIPAVTLFKMIGPENGIALAKNLGLPLTKEDRYLSLALGGFTQGVSPLHMAGAYTCFANLGAYRQPQAVTRIVDSQGNEYTPVPETRQVISANAAYRMTEMLVTTVQSGTGYRAQMRRPVAGKTGTTELPQVPDFKWLKGNKDAWFVGYTPELTAAVWMGYDHTDAKHYLKQIYGGSYPAQIFREVLNPVLQDVSVQSFPQPEGYVAARAGRFLGPDSSPYSPRAAVKPQETVEVEQPPTEQPAPSPPPAEPLPPLSPKPPEITPILP